MAGASGESRELGGSRRKGDGVRAQDGWGIPGVPHVPTLPMAQRAQESSTTSAWQGCAAGVGKAGGLSLVGSEGGCFLALTGISCQPPLLASFELAASGIGCEEQLVPFPAPLSPCELEWIRIQESSCPEQLGTGARG